MTNHSQTSTTALLLGLAAGCFSAAIYSIPASADVNVTGAGIQVSDANGTLLCIAQVKYRLISADPAGKHYGVVPGTDRCQGKDGVTYDLQGNRVANTGTTGNAQTSRPTNTGTTGNARTSPLTAVLQSGDYLDCNGHYHTDGRKYDATGNSYRAGNLEIPIPAHAKNLPQLGLCSRSPISSPVTHPISSPVTHPVTHHITPHSNIGGTSHCLASGCYTPKPTTQHSNIGGTTHQCGAASCHAPVPTKPNSNIGGTIHQCPGGAICPAPKPTTLLPTGIKFKP